MKSVYDLTKNQLNEVGFAGPLPLLSETECTTYKHKFFSELDLPIDYNLPLTVDTSYWEQSKRWVYDLATHPKIIDAVSAYLGNDIFLFGSSFWYRPSGVSEATPWHQDGPFWDMEPRKAITVWMSLEDVPKERGALKFLLGSHLEEFEHIEQETAHRSFSKCIPEEEIDERRVVTVEMSKGEMVAFGESTAHASSPCTDGKPRIAYAARYCSPESRFPVETWSKEKSARRVILIKGEDRFQLNNDIKIAPPI